MITLRCRCDTHILNTTFLGKSCCTGEKERKACTSKSPARQVTRLVRSTWGGGGGACLFEATFFGT